jgi:Mce-associated membrane protein
VAKLAADPVDEAITLEAEDTSPASEPSDSAGDAHGAPPDRATWWRRVLLIGLAIALVAGIAFAAIQGQDWCENRHYASERKDALSTARKVAVTVSTSDYQRIDEDLAAILKLATGNFASTVRTNQASQAELVKTYKVQSTAKVDEIGVVSQDDDKVVVAVAVSSLIKNSRNRAGQEQWYRMVIDVEQQKNDKWLASNVEFVQ